MKMVDEFTDVGTDRKPDDAPEPAFRRHRHGMYDRHPDPSAGVRIVRDRFKTARKAMRALPAADHTRFALAARQCTLGRYVESDRRNVTVRPEEVTILDWVIWAVGAYIENLDQRRAVMAYIAGAKMVEIGDMLGGSRSRQAVERRLVRIAEKLSQSVPSTMFEPKKAPLGRF